MVKSVDVLIVGGGISGLTLANLLVHCNKGVNFRIKIFEARNFQQSQHAAVGGGIGLWPSSQSVLRHLPGYQELIEDCSYQMPNPSYRDAKGRVLARAKDNFSRDFPVHSLNRNDLINWLLGNLQDKENVAFIPSQKISDYERIDRRVVVKTDDGQEHSGDLLIACDGIHSKIRNEMMAEMDLPAIHETDLGYTYFRASTKVDVDADKKWWSEAFETWGSHESQELGNQELRFGYVPLKPPEVFWFIAIKTQANHPYLAPIKGVESVNDETKQFLKKLVQSWKPVKNDSGEDVVDYLELIDSSEEILRTDIAKIAEVEKFPWVSNDKRVLLIGDAVHATAPNIAQGAGLCIEDAASLASKLNREDFLYGLSEFEQERKQRAKTVQSMADLVASVGQTSNPFLKLLRNEVMHTTTKLLPSVQQSLFNYTVSYSLGGTNKVRYWEAPQSLNPEGSQGSLFARAFQDVALLDEHVSEFKTSTTGGSGKGTVTIEKPTLFSRIVGCFAGFPKTMNEQAFFAEVINLSSNVQRWNRVFASKTPNQKTYSTTHSTYCDYNRQVFLSEGVGGFFDKAFRFIYNITLEADKSLKYQSQGLTFFDLFKIPLPNCLLPKSEWFEKPTEKGWEFDGTISYPLVGTLMHYFGQFELDKKERKVKRKLIIAGGSGLIGREVCKEFLRKGYDVYCLSRSAKTPLNLAGVKVRELNGDWSDLIDNHTVIVNLSGSNPGSSRWTDEVKNDIAGSRYKTIDTILSNIDKASEKPLKYLQASAAGFYGNAGNLLLTEDSEPVVDSNPGTNFRVSVCQEIEQRASKAQCNVVNLRIGHVLANKGGLLPYYRLSGFFNAGRFGAGSQFVPFVHIKDVAKSIEFIASNEDITDGAVNLTAPNVCTNSEMLKALRLAKWIPGIPLPESVLRQIIGESSAILTDSERVIPQKLLDNGYEFEYPTIQDSINGLN